jgi:hypothetical protein
MDHVNYCENGDFFHSLSFSSKFKKNNTEAAPKADAASILAIFRLHRKLSKSEDLRQLEGLYDLLVIVLEKVPDFLNDHGILLFLHLTAYRIYRYKVHPPHRLSELSLL